MKNNKNNAENGKKEIFNYAEIDFNKVDDIVKLAEVTEYKKGLNRYQYPLCGGVTLIIYETDKDYDFGNLNIYGVSINVVIRAGKKGMFLSYPSVKNSKGEYTNQVTNYSKNLINIINEVLNAHYEE